jgi:hypothetical protein
MAKRMYADVVMNGQAVNLALRASSEKEARTKLATAPEYKGVTKVVEVSPYPPRKEEIPIDEPEIPLGKPNKHRLGLYTGGKIATY